MKSFSEFSVNFIRKVATELVNLLYKHQVGSSGTRAYIGKPSRGFSAIVGLALNVIWTTLRSSSSHVFGTC